MEAGLDCSSFFILFLFLFCFGESEWEEWKFPDLDLFVWR